MPVGISAELPGEIFRKTLGRILKKVQWRILRNIFQEITKKFWRIFCKYSRVICGRIPLGKPSEIPRLASVKISKKVLRYF